MSTSFDDVSKALASGVSRRHALKLMAGGVGGTVLASMGLGRARAAVSSCAAFCANFHGAAHAQCMQTCKDCGSDVTRLCANYFPAPSVTCCPGPGPVTCCFGPNGATTCCPTNSTCCGGPPGTTVTCCPSTMPACCSGPSGTTACCDSYQHCCNDASGNAVCCSTGETCCYGVGCCAAGDICCFAPTGPFCCTPGTAGCCA